MEDGEVSVAVLRSAGLGMRVCRVEPSQQMVMVMDHWRLGRLPDRIDTLQLRYRYIYTSH